VSEKERSATKTTEASAGRRPVPTSATPADPIYSRGQARPLRPDRE